MRSRTTTGAAAALVAASAVGAALLPAAGAAAAPALSAEVAVEGRAVVTTAHVPLTADPVHVARAYDYELYATCWSRSGVPQRRYVTRVATARVPAGAGDTQLRVPPDERTTFRFADPAAALAATTAVRPLTCPKHLSPGLLRVHVTDWTVTVTSLDGSSETASGTSDVDVWFTAPEPVVGAVSAVRAAAARPTGSR